MKLCLSGGTFSQIYVQDKRRVPDILFSDQTELEVLSQKEPTVLQNKDR